MGFFSKLFGGKKKQDSDRERPKSSSQPKSYTKDYETPQRTFAKMPDDVDVSDYKLAGVARIDIIIMMGKMIGADLPYQQEGIIYEALSDEGVISIPLVVSKNDKLYGVFAFYSEAEAANFKKFRELLTSKCGFEEVYYISAFDPEKYTIADGEVEKGTTFHAVFKKEEQPKEEAYEGRYAVWWSSTDDPLFIDSRTAHYYQEINEAIKDYGSYFCGIFMSGLARKDFERILLPQEPATVYVTGPNEQRCLIMLSEANGFQFLLPRDKVDAAYRHNLLKLISKSMVFLRKGLIEREVPKDDPQHRNVGSAFDKMMEDVRAHQPVMENVSQVIIGNPVVPEQKRAIDLNKVIIRVKAGDVNIEVKKDGKTIKLEDGQQPAFADFQENFKLGLAMDMGHSYEFISNQLLQDSEFSFGDLIEAGRVNILKEVQGNIQIVGSPEEGMVMITCGGNHESALIMFDEFWEQVEGMIKSDICMAIPVRDMLLVSNFYNTKGMDDLRANIQKLYHDPNQRGHISNHIYLRKEGRWKSIEVVEKT